MKPIFTMLCGLPRSGKSTWVENRETNHEVVISNDWIREHILGVQYCEAANAIVWTIIDATMRICLGQGKDVILDAVNHHSAIRKFYIDIARKYNAQVMIIVFDTPLEECLKREHKVPEEVLRQMHKDFELPTLLECDQIIHIKPEKIKHDDLEKPLQISDKEWDTLNFFQKLEIKRRFI